MRVVARLALRAAAVSGPIHEISQAVAVFPGETKEFSCREIVRFVAEERFKAPAKIGAVPGLEAVAACDDPVVAKGAKHLAQPGLRTNLRKANCENQL